MASGGGGGVSGSWGGKQRAGGKGEGGDASYGADETVASLGAGFFEVEGAPRVAPTKSRIPPRHNDERIKNEVGGDERIVTTAANVQQNATAAAADDEDSVALDARARKYAWLANNSMRSYVDAIDWDEVRSSGGGEKEEEEEEEEEDQRPEVYGRGRRARRPAETHRERTTSLVSVQRLYPLYPLVRDPGERTSLSSVSASPRFPHLRNSRQYGCSRCPYRRNSHPRSPRRHRHDHWRVGRRRHHPRSAFSISPRCSGASCI